MKKKKTLKNLQICGDMPDFRHQKTGRAIENGQAGNMGIVAATTDAKVPASLPRRL